MAENGQGVDFKKYIIILKNTTLAVQIIPFVYSFLYIIVLFFYPHISDDTASILDTLFYISPTFIVGFLILSRLLHLCKWHKMACLLPAFPQIITVIDYYIIELTEIEAQIIDYLGSVMSLLLVISAYKVFFSNGRK